MSSAQEPTGNARATAEPIDAREWNFDGLVGPTHNYAGLSPGNLASEGNRGRRSNPRAAALQGLAKMKRLHDLGVPQAIFPPHPRPALAWLGRLGFGRHPETILTRAARDAPALLAAATSASSMWAANAATVSPSADTADTRIHVTPANLASEVHRSLEASYTTALLRALFSNSELFCVHDPLPAALADEGAANHMRLAPEYGSPGFHVFVYGLAEAKDAPAPRHHPARQREAASRAVARQHGIDPARVAFVQQQPAAIDGGVFHNDVIATSDRRLLWVHERAWHDGVRARGRIEGAAAAVGVEVSPVVTPETEVTLHDAVATYLFNSQIVRAATGERVWVGPEECRGHEGVCTWLERHAGVLFDRREDVDLRESMRNGGGPACLRLRVVMTAWEAAELPGGVLYSPERHDALAACIEQRYRDRVTPADLADPAWAEECHAAHAAILEVLGLDGCAALRAE